jgi:hypothetical protein
LAAASTKSNLSAGSLAHAGLKNGTHVDLLDFASFKVAASKCTLGGDLTEVSSGHVAEAAHEGSNSGTLGSNDDSVDRSLSKFGGHNKVKITKH